MQTRKKRAREELESLRRFLQGEVVHESGVQVLKINPSVGDGFVQCVCFDEGLIAMEFNIALRENRTVGLNSGQKSMIYFLYCLKGHTLHQFVDEEVINKLGELQTAVVSNSGQGSSEIIIPQGERLIFNIIRLDKKMYRKKFKDDYEGFDANTLYLLDASTNSRGFFHLGKINLEIGELIKMLEKAKYVGNLATLLQFKGICHLILAKQLAQFRFDMEYGQMRPTTLLNRELQLISQLSDAIKSNPEVQYNIRLMCLESGLSAAKLQQGFRFVHDMTVGEFVRNARLIEAEFLLRTTEMNISEVVYAIGFTSRSYFCKIFKAKYRCSPKQYKQGILGRSLGKSA